ELPRTSLAEAYSWAYSEDRPRNEQPPTPKQLAFIGRLYSERPSLEPQQPATKRAARELIDTLLKMSKDEPSSSGLIELLTNVPDGYYALPSKTSHNDLDFICVRTQHGKRYVNRYVGGQGQIYIHYSEQRVFAQLLAGLTEDEHVSAQRLFGHELGRCGRCGRSLTDEQSRARGFGPD